MVARPLICILTHFSGQNVAVYQWSLKSSFIFDPCMICSSANTSHTSCAEQQASKRCLEQRNLDLVKVYERNGKTESLRKVSKLKAIMQAAHRSRPSTSLERPSYYYLIHGNQAAGYIGWQKGKGRKHDASAARAKGI